MYIVLNSGLKFQKKPSVISKEDTKKYLWGSSEVNWRPLNKQKWNEKWSKFSPD